MYYDFGLYLIRARHASGLTQEQAAEMLDVSVRTLAKWESNQVRPNINRMESIIELYGDERLAWQWLYIYKMGRRICKDLNDIPLSENILSLAVNLKQVNELLTELMAIGADGVVDAKEKSKYSQMMVVFGRLSEDILKLQYQSTKKPAPVWAGL